MRGWQVEREVAPAGVLHGRPVPVRGRVVTFCETVRPAVVLGSAQPVSDVDVERASATGVDVVRRRSGGGAVLLQPGRLVWADVVIPRHDPLWEPDVGHAFWWLGRVWTAALGDLGSVGAVAHAGPLFRSRWSGRVCFAGLGPGEVAVGGRKVVGISQRRTREAALFQCAALLSWDPRSLLDLLALDAPDREAAGAELAVAATGIPGRRAEEVEAALVAHLP